jgi:4'-phosphopantetheinyl transferase
MSNLIAKSAAIFLLDIHAISDDELTSSLCLLSPTELIRYHRIARTLRQRQFLAGRLLLRNALATLLNSSALRISLTEQERQAPLLHIDGIAHPPHFSISHTGSWVACACSHSVRLGLDIEQHDANRNLAAIGEHTFQADDVAWINSQPDQVAAFYRLWSIKEARFKLTQQYAVAEFEYCYELPHPAMSMVLMTDQALDAAPQVLKGALA